MTWPFETDVTLAISKLKMIVMAAENSNHNGEIAAIRASEAWALEKALRLVLPEIRNSFSSGDGRFTAEQLEAIDDALVLVSGPSHRILAEAA